MPAKKLVFEELLDRLYWHNATMRFIHTVPSTVEEFAVLWELAMTWPMERFTNELADAAGLQHRSVSPILKRFSDIVPPPRHRHLQDKGWRLTPVDLPVLNTPRPAWTSAEQIEQHEQDLAKIRSLDLSPLEKLVLKLEWYHGDLSNAETALLAHASCGQTINGINATLRDAELIGPSPRDRRPTGLTERIIPLITKPRTTEQLQELTGATAQAVRDAARRAERRGIITITHRSKLGLDAQNLYLPVEQKERKQRTKWDLRGKNRKVVKELAGQFDGDPRRFALALDAAGFSYLAQPEYRTCILAYNDKKQVAKRLRTLQRDALNW